MQEAAATTFLSTIGDLNKTKENDNKLLFYLTKTKENNNKSLFYLTKMKVSFQIASGLVSFDYNNFQMIEDF